MKATIEGSEIVIRIPITSPRPSASGKTLVIASTNGNAKPDGLRYEGRQVVLGVNAYIAKEG